MTGQTPHTPRSAQGPLSVVSLKSTTDRLTEGHSEDCDIYVGGDETTPGDCDCGYEKATFDVVAAAGEFEDWLFQSEKEAQAKMENSGKHDRDRHDYEVMLRTLGMVRRKYEGTT